MIRLCRWMGHWWGEQLEWGVRMCRLCRRREKAFYEDGYVHYRECEESWDCQP